MNYFVDPEDRPGCPLAMPGRAVPLIQKNAACGKTYVEGEFRILDVDWEPKCLVVVIAPDSRKLLFEELTVRDFTPHNLAGQTSRSLPPVHRKLGAS